MNFCEFLNNKHKYFYLYNCFITLMWNNYYENNYKELAENLVLFLSQIFLK